MDALRALQLLTDLAYFALGIAAVAAALSSRERARMDVAILFGALAITVGLQEVRLLSCATQAGCVDVPLRTQLSTIMVLVVPYALLRLVDDISDIPSRLMWVSLIALIALGMCFVFGGPTPPVWLVVLLGTYLIAGTVFAAW